MSDCCDITFSLVTCCCVCVNICTDDPAACSSCGCKKQNENPEIVFPEVVQNQPRKKDPMIANDARSQRITHDSTSGGGQDNMG